MPTRKRSPLRNNASHIKKQGADSEPALAQLENNLDAIGTHFAISRTTIMEKYWELANLEPEVTKGNIAGQLRALDCLFQGLDGILSDDADPHSPPAKQSEIYRSAWMRRGNATEAENAQ